MNLVVVALISWLVGRTEVTSLNTPPRPGSPMSQLMRSTEELQACLRREYPSWSPEADMQKSVARRLIDRSIDYREISRRALGRNWDRLSDDDRSEFVTDLSRLIQSRSLSRGLDVGPDLRVHFERESVSERGTASVYATILAPPKPNSRSVEVEYRLLWKGDHWAVYDLLTDGDSLLEGYRAQFDRIIARESIAGLLRRMKRAESRIQE
ncbi:MAG TPA: ABC transporter substrate-binding protein [Polyangia bacterium]|nr:ABC transporter substrate-binding protein [Polyangia bacterium]